MEGDDLINAAHIVGEPIYERRVITKQGAERRHIMGVPCRLKRSRRIFGIGDRRHVSPL